MDFDSIFKRIASKTDLKNQTQLANFLGNKQPQVSKQKNKNSFPVEWAFKIAQHYNLSTDWIMTGKEKTPIKEHKKIDNSIDILIDLQTWLNEITCKEPHRKDWFRGTIEDAFPMFKKWRDKKEKNNKIPNKKIA